jgi:hypothetical protein
MHREREKCEPTPSQMMEFKTNPSQNNPTKMSTCALQNSKNQKPFVPGNPAREGFSSKETMPGYAIHVLVHAMQKCCAPWFGIMSDLSK